jgi:hypothetical protein
MGRSQVRRHHVKGDLMGLLIGFHPQQRPVLWRLLVTQALFYDTLLATTDARVDKTPISVAEVSAEQFEWRTETDDASAEDINVTLEVGRTYLSRQLDIVRSRILARGGGTSPG